MSGRLRDGDAKAGGHAPRGRFAPRRDRGCRLPCLREYCSRRGFRRAGVEGRLRCIGHIELDGLRHLVAPQIAARRKAPSMPAVTPAAKIQSPSIDHAFVDGNGPEQRQQMKRRPVRRRARPLQQAGRAATAKHPCIPRRCCARPRPAAGSSRARRHPPSALPGRSRRAHAAHRAAAHRRTSRPASAASPSDRARARSVLP